MESRRKIKLGNESFEALKNALVGVKSRREEAFVLLTAIPEPYLPELVDYLRVWLGWKNMIADMEGTIINKMDRIFSKIISGGQTSMDRAALDVALVLGIPCGGWCPKGRRAEDGKIPPKYPLLETTSTEYKDRTEKNVTESDGTLIITYGPFTGGTAFTVRIAKKLKRPYYIADLAFDNDVNHVQAWLRWHEIKIINVAGPRESKVPGIHDMATRFLINIITEKGKGQSGS